MVRRSLLGKENEQGCRIDMPNDETRTRTCPNVADIVVVSLPRANFETCLFNTSIPSCNLPLPPRRRMTLFLFLTHTTTGKGNTQDPVRSPYDKPLTGGLVVRWVTTGESPLLYVFPCFFALVGNSLSYRVASNLELSANPLAVSALFSWSRHMALRTDYPATAATPPTTKSSAIRLPSVYL